MTYLSLSLRPASILGTTTATGLTSTTIGGGGTEVLFIPMSAKEGGGGGSFLPDRDTMLGSAVLIGDNVSGGSFLNNLLTFNA